MMRTFRSSFLILAVLSFLLFFSLADLLLWSTFSDDDTHVSQLALSYDWLSPYYQPHVYQQLSIVHFTPVVLSAYRGILSVFGVETLPFVVMQISLISLITALAAYICQQLTKRSAAGILCVLLIFSSTMLFPMLSRFYTMHYLLGALCSLLVLQIIIRAVQENNLSHPTTFLFIFGLTFAALLAKEVYIMLVPLLWIVLWQRKSYQNIAAVTLSLVGYLALRTHMLGFSTDGRMGNSLISDLLAIKGDVWLSFAVWFAKENWLLLVMISIGFISASQKMLLYIFAAGLFALPSLAAPHAFQTPQLHGDRLFFMFNIMLSIAATLAIFSRSDTNNSRYQVVIIGLILVMVPLQRSELSRFKDKQIARPSYSINQALLNETVQESTIVVTPGNYYQGELMNVYRLLGNPWLYIIQNCQQALSLTDNGIVDAPTLIAFDEQANRLTRDQLQQRCQFVDQPAIVASEPTFSNGLLEWSISVPDGYQGGVMLVDRGISIPVTQFKQRLVRPKPGERYQLFTRKGNQWWFSETKLIQVEKG